MLTQILIAVAAVVAAVLVGFVSRRVLGTAVGWPRSIVVGLLVVVIGIPFADWVLRQTLGDDGTTLTAIRADTVWLALGIIALALAWVFALGVAALVALEAIFPTHPLPNPIDVVRAGASYDV